jgi:hypothetical protein
MRRKSGREKVRADRSWHFPFILNRFRREIKETVFRWKDSENRCTRTFSENDFKRELEGSEYLGPGQKEQEPKK